MCDIEGYCQNSIRCDRERLACICKENYEGDRCERRTGMSSSSICRLSASVCLSVLPPSLFLSVSFSLSVSVCLSVCFSLSQSCVCLSARLLHSLSVFVSFSSLSPVVLSLAVSLSLSITSSLSLSPSTSLLVAWIYFLKMFEEGADL